MNPTSNISAILTDVEGTTSSVAFIKEVLFPYARERLPDYVRDHQIEILDLLKEVRTRENNPDFDVEDIIDTFMRWMDEDRKITPLKTLQGLIWEKGYKSGELKGHIYDDALRALQAWHKRGLPVYIYSSGSVAAQHLLFGHTKHGDLTPLFSGYFDTAIGPKLEADSYKKIAAELRFPPEKILFLSDHEGEIKAATQAGIKTLLVDREGINTQAIRSFDDIPLREKVA
jgi:enolase-phosphatase E1